MCLFFDLLIPKKTNISKFGFNEELIQWGGEYFSQEPKKFLYKNKYKFTQYAANEPFLTQKLGNKIQLDEFYLYLLNDANYYLSLHQIGSHEENGLFDFITYLMNLNISFHIILHHDDDENIIYENMSEAQRIISIINENINTENTLIISKVS